MDVDFKRKAVSMTDDQFKKAYEDLVPMRNTDNTQDTIDFVFKEIVGEEILEVGCGNGDISIECAKRGYKVAASDIAEGNLDLIKLKSADQKIEFSTVVANIEALPFRDKSFDTTICLHTLEHVRNLHAAVSELKRVSRKRLIVIVPRQKFFRYTPDYHLNFFGESEQLAYSIGVSSYQCRVIDHCLCYSAKMND